MTTSEIKRALTDPSRRLDAVPAYMFAELERRVEDMRERGVDVISLGIGDPDRPTYPHVVGGDADRRRGPRQPRLPL